MVVGRNAAGNQDADLTIAMLQDLLKPSNGYLNDGKITIVCNITVTLPAISEAAAGLLGVKRRCTDVKVIMGDRHVYANKGVSIIARKQGSSSKIDHGCHVSNLAQTSQKPWSLGPFDASV